MRIAARLLVFGFVGAVALYSQNTEVQPQTEAAADRDVSQALRTLDGLQQDVQLFTRMSAIANLSTLGVFGLDFATGGSEAFVALGIAAMTGDLVAANLAVTATRNYIDLAQWVDPALDTSRLSRSSQTVRTSFLLFGGGFGVTLGGLIVAGFPLLMSFTDPQNRDSHIRTAEYIIVGGAVVGLSAVVISFPVRLGGTIAMRRRIRALHAELSATAGVGDQGEGR